jgi:heptosyltransferase-1
MGDIIHTLPAASALRHAFPEAVIGWVVEERWAELLCTLPTPRSGPRSPQRPLVDHIHTVDTAKWRKAKSSLQTWQEMAAVLSDLRAPSYQTAVDFQGAIRSALIARCSRTPAIFGAMQPRENVASMFYTRQVVARGAHIVEQNLSLAEAVAGQRLAMPEVQFPHDAAAERTAGQRMQSLGKFVLINPGAGWGAKQWPAERYAEVARALAAEGLRSLINFGPGEEELAQKVEASSGGAAAPCSSSLTQLIALTRRASLFIGGDTGPMHLAATLGIPVVAIFGPTDPARNGPFSARSRVLRSPSSLTSHSRRTQPEQGLLEISVAQVLAAARQLLGERHG